MARTRSKTLTVPAVVQVNAIDLIVSKLNELTGIEFAKDAWVNEAPEVYGVVTLAGTEMQSWADDRLLDTVWNVAIYAFVSDDDDSWPEKIREKLEELEDEGRIITTNSVTREFDYDSSKVRWEWTVMMFGPLTWTE